MYLSLLLPNGERIVDQKSYSFDTSDLEEGEFSIGIFAQDEAKNSISSKIMFEKISSGKVKINIFKKYKLDQIIEAHKDLEGRKILGPAVILP